MDNHATRKIVIVDDEPANVKLLMALLRDFDFDIHAIHDSQQALAEIEEIIPDLVLLDVQMPLVNGLEIAEKMRANDKTKDIPIIFVSARNDMTTIKEGLKHAAVDYIVKPVKFKQLVSSVQNALHQQS